ncbi:MAG: hypothetical protein ACR2PF_14680, partial [Rhizobiaceae bacterium]
MTAPSKDVTLSITEVEGPYERWARVSGSNVTSDKNAPGVYAGFVTLSLTADQTAGLMAKDLLGGIASMTPMIFPGSVRNPHGLKYLPVILDTGKPSS